MMGISAWLLASRPRTLVAALVPVALGATLAKYTHGQIRWDLSLLALASAGAIQIGTNLINDAMDHRKGADTEERLGPVRVTQSGLLAERVVLGAGLACLGLALLAGIPLVVAGGWPILVLGLLSLLCGYAYTGGPFPLAYKGMGELFVILFFGLAAVGGVYFLNTAYLSVGALVAGLQVGLLATVLLAVNNLRDRQEDLGSGKGTLAVRWGARWGRLEVALCALSPFALQLYWLPRSRLFALPLLALPLALVVVLRVYRHPPGTVYNGILGQSAVLQLLFGLLFSIGLWHA